MPDRGEGAGHRYRVIVSANIGGTDPDDFQSMVHFLPCADVFDAAVFGVVEIALPLPTGMTRANTARLIVDSRIPAVAANDGDELRFGFSPREARVWPYVIRSDFAGPEGVSGCFTAVPLPHERAASPSAVHPNWWIDDPDVAAEGIHPGAKNVSRWRGEFLRDFAVRALRRNSAVGPDSR